MRKPSIAIIGAGFSGAVLARELAENGNFQITVFDSKGYVGGNAHTFRDSETDIMVHHHGPHILHTDREEIWEYANRWGRFEPYVKRVKAITDKGIFQFPFNLMTLNQFYNKKLSPKEARDFLGSLSKIRNTKASNLEDYALKHYGEELYNNFIRDYTLKTWGIPPKKLSPILIKKIPIHLNYDDCYYKEKYQGIPISGYTEIIKRILDHHSIEVRLDQSFDLNRKREFDHLFWTGPIDSFFDNKFGQLRYRTFSYETTRELGDFQGTAITHFTDSKTPFTRITEYKHLTPWERHEKTLYTREYPKNSTNEDSPQLPLRQEEDLNILKQYLEAAQMEKRITFLGRLGTYRYLNMGDSISEALDLARECLKRQIEEWPAFSTSSQDMMDA